MTKTSGAAAPVEPAGLNPHENEEKLLYEAMLKKPVKEEAGVFYTTPRIPTPRTTCGCFTSSTPWPHRRNRRRGRRAGRGGGLMEP